MTVEKPESLGRLVELFKEVREIGMEIAPQTMLTFLLIAEAMPEGILQSELTPMLGISGSAVQRNIVLLTDEVIAGKPGYGLVEQHPVPGDKRKRLLKLSYQGERKVEKLRRLVE